MNPSPQQVPAAIRAKLAAFAARERQVRLLQGAAETLLALDLALLVGALLLWLLKPALAGRVTLSTVVYGAALGVFLWRTVWPALRKWSLLKVAARFEQAAGNRLHERLLSAVELSAVRPPGTSDWMADRTLALAAEDLAPLRPAELVETRQMVARWKLALAVACVLLLVTALAPRRVWVVLNPLANPATFAANSFAVAPGNCRVPAGASVDIRAQSRLAFDQALLVVRWQDGFREELAMARPGGTNLFQQTIARVSQGFRYRVQAGETTTAEFEVAVETPPKLDGLQLDITPPAYTRLPVRPVNGGSAEILAGSRVQIGARLSGSPARASDLLADRVPPKPMTLHSNLASVEVLPLTNLTYCLRLVGRNGLTNVPPERWTLRVVPDEPPTATLAGKGLDTGTVGSEEALLLDATAQDDVGLAKLELLVTAGSNTFRQPFPLENKLAGEAPGQRAASQATLNLAGRNLEVGDEVQLLAEATDLAGNRGRSEPIKLVIAKPGSAEAAQLALRLRAHVREMDAAVSAFQQARTQWGSFLRGAGADPAESDAELRLVRQQLDQVHASLARAATNLFAESGQVRHAVAPYLANLSGALGTWADAQQRILGAALTDVAADPGPARAAAIARARDLMEHAGEELADFRMHVALAPAALEAEVLASSAEAAQGRYQRSLPVLRAAKGWDVNASPGLAASFYAGRALTGTPALTKVDVPRFDNFEVPKVGRENWCARYTGELQIPEAGKWEFAVTANDGVRLFVDDKSLLPGDAWADKGTREHKAKLELAAGWHPIRIEFFQTGGPNQLHVRLGKEGRGVQEVAADRLRPSSAAHVEPPKIAGLTPAAVVSATNRLAQSLAAVARVSPELARLEMDVPIEPLQRLATEKSNVGAELEEGLRQLPAWTAPDASRTEARADNLVAAAREGNRILQERLSQERWRLQQQTADFQAMRVPLEQVRVAAERMKPAEWNRKRQDLQATKRREVTAAQSWAQELQRATQATDRELFARARAGDTSLAERSQALQASLRLEREAQRSVGNLGELLQSAGREEKVAEKIEREVQKLDGALNELRRVGELERASQTARLAEAALSETARGPATAKPALDRLTATQRRAGDLPQAEALEKAAAQADPAALVNQLAELAQRAAPSAESVARLVPPPMREGVRRLEQAPQSQPETAESLAKARLGLALEGERLRREGQARPAAAYAKLGNDLGALLSQPAKLTPQNLRPLAERANALAEARDARSRERASEQVLSSSPALAEGTEAAAEAAAAADALALAGQLDQLSREAAQAAGEQSKRAPLKGPLQEMATLPTSATSARELAADAASQAASTIQAAPGRQTAYRKASTTLADGASSLRLARATAEAAGIETAAQLAANARAEAQGQAQTGAPSARPGPGSLSAPGTQPKEGSYTRAAGDAVGLNRELSGQQQAEWAKLREKLRDAGQGGGAEHFSEEQQEAIRAYFKRLAKE